MYSSCPIVLATIDGQSAAERLQLVIVPAGENGTRLELRQQSWSQSVGWYTQSSVAIEPHQVAELRNSLGIGGQAGRLRRAGAPSLADPDSPAPPEQPLRIVG